ncbi:hypothetical protein DYB37_010013 [Aphanomyces astaci]|uniref:No apical meristem-associated C-terminal domain-containing protein n=1 Tax=Aphanomyces astaci TaxID=112090 RepID=A0A418ETC3_APHAT|nr:hypothetical protein DYB37_010013 [Aphanomyces astaci]
MARGEAWDAPEDIQLTSSWLATSEDSSAAAGQKASDFNKRVYEHWHENKTTTNHGSRSPVAIASRWKTLCPMLTSFNSNAIQALKAIPSGWNEDGVIDNELYAIPDVKRHGIVLACWRIVRDAPKWRGQDVSLGKRNAFEILRPTGTKQAKLAKQVPAMQAHDELHARFVKAPERRRRSWLNIKN